MTDIKKFTSFATSNCYLISPFDNEIVFLIDLPPNIDEVINYINTNNLTIARNSSKIHGADEDLTVAVERAANTLVFTDSTQGWLLKSK